MAEYVHIRAAVKSHWACAVCNYILWSA